MNIILKLLRNGVFLQCIAFIAFSEPVLSQKKRTKHTVEIKKMKFVPPELTIHKGDTVVWVNRDIFPHDVTESKNKTWSSSTLEQGKSWYKVITKSTNYYCSLHIVMKGELIVK